MQPKFIPVVEDSQVFAARQAGRTMAAELNWGEELTGKLSIILSEAATNLVKHAKRGEIYLRRYEGGGVEGIEVLSLDRGPGVARVEACMADGYSTTGTAGTGLGAICRLAHEFDIYSQEGKGTCMVARLLPAARDNSATRSPRKLKLGCALLAVQGETECGDDWGMRSANGQTTILLADGLGHGPGAAEASREAVATFERAKNLAPAAILENVHLALRPTRGAAVAIAQIDTEQAQVRFAGAGNIVGILLNGMTQQNMISHNGTAGHNVRKIQEFCYPWKKNTVLVMHSDGINTSWRFESYPGIGGHDPSLLAAALLRDASRVRDDACVLVACEER
jgi:anti-sigma regulatory factor (Ser/Thr protein kinase)